VQIRRYDPPAEPVFHSVDPGPVLDKINALFKPNPQLAKLDQRQLLKLMRKPWMMPGGESRWKAGLSQRQIPRYRVTG
jgi:hypothetical protein